MIATKTCVEVTCDGCGSDSFEELTPHFDSLSEAESSLTIDYHWTFDGGRHWCEACADRLHCERLGHMWEPWHLEGSPHQAMCARCGRLDTVGGER